MMKTKLKSIKISREKKTFVRLFLRHKLFDAYWKLLDKKISEISDPAALNKLLVFLKRQLRFIANNFTLFK